MRVHMTGRSGTTLDFIVSHVERRAASCAVNPRTEAGEMLVFPVHTRLPWTDGAASSSASLTAATNRSGDVERQGQLSQHRRHPILDQ